MKRFFRLLADVAVVLLVVGACVAVYRLGVMTLIEKVLPPDDFLVTVLRRVGVTASLLLGYWAAARYYERRRVTELALKPVAIAAGALSGMALIGMSILALYALSYYQLHSFRGLAAALPIASMILFAAIFEEVMFRGVVFRILEQYAGTVMALVVQAVIFGGLHLFNEGTSVMTMISVTLLGAFWAAIYVYSRNLWVVIANHVAWNVTIFVTGLPLSGQEQWRLSAPFESGYHGPVWLTGGGFGPEDSILNILVLACAFAALYRGARRKGRIVPR